MKAARLANRYMPKYARMMSGTIVAATDIITRIIRAGNKV
jgi:hypothetical protein